MAEETKGTNVTEEADKREHSLKPEVDDLTNYQSLNSLGGAGVAGTAKETPVTEPSVTETSATDTSASGENEAAPPTDTESSEVTTYSEDYNDGSDFSAVDNDGETNA